MSVVSCKHKPTAAEEAESNKATAAREALEAKQKTAVTTRLRSIAALEAKMKTLPAQSSKSNHFTLQAKGPGTAPRDTNYDVLFVEQLADPSKSPPVRVTREPAFEGCVNYMAHKDTVYDSCKYGTCMSICEKAQYLVVLRTRSITQPTMGTSTYTAGSLDADAFVFDLENGDKLVGGGRIVASNAGQGSVEGAGASNSVTDAFGQAVSDAVAGL